MIIKSVRKSTFNLFKGTNQACGLHWGILAHSCYSRGKKTAKGQYFPIQLEQARFISSLLYDKKIKKKCNTPLMTVSMKILTKNLERTNAIIKEFELYY